MARGELPEEMRGGGMAETFVVDASIGFRFEPVVAESQIDESRSGDLGFGAQVIDMQILDDLCGEFPRI